MRRSLSKLVRWPVLLACAAMLAACVTLLAPYDDKFDTMATELQRKVSTHIEALDGAVAPDCLYANHTAFYDEARVDVSALAVRANSHDLNAPTIGQVESLRSSLDDFEKLHQLASARPRCLSSAEMSPIRRAFDSILAAILKLEMAKKRGK
jgi:hypothetical protein